MYHRLFQFFSRLVGIQHRVDHAIPEAAENSADALRRRVVPDFLRQIGESIDNHDAGNAAVQTGTCARHDFVCIRAADGTSRPGVSRSATRD